MAVLRLVTECTAFLLLIIGLGLPMLITTTTPGAFDNFTNVCLGVGSFFLIVRVLLLKKSRLTNKNPSTMP
jgi:hypothetical protein